MTRPSRCCCDAFVVVVAVVEDDDGLLLKWRTAVLDDAVVDVAATVFGYVRRRISDCEGPKLPPCCPCCTRGPCQPSPSCPNLGNRELDAETFHRRDNVLRFAISSS